MGTIPPFADREADSDATILPKVAQLVSNTLTQAGSYASHHHTRPPLKGFKLRNDVKTGLQIPFKRISLVAEWRVD